MRCFILSALLLMGAQARAQDSLFRLPAEHVMAMGARSESQTVVTASQKSETITDVPASMVVITQQQIQERGYQDLSDVLKDLPAFDYVENASRYGEFYAVRGIDGNDRFLVLVNGRKINSPNGTFLSVGNSIGIGFAERIEIVYGACSIMYGADAFSCVINIISKEIPPQARTSAQANYGSYATTDVSFQTNLPIRKDFSLQVFGRSYTSQGFDNAGWGDFDVVNTYQQPLNNTYQQPIKDHTIFAELRYKDFRLGFFRQYFNEGNARGMNPSIYIYNAENRWAVHKNIGWLNYTKNLKHGGQLSADLSYTYHFQDDETRFYRFLGTSLFSQFMTGKDKDLKLWVNYTQHIGKKLNVIFGAQAEHIEGVPPYANDAAFGAPLRYQGTQARTIDEQMTVRETRFGAFGQASYRILPKLQFVGGLRLDYSNVIAETLNPRLALIYQPREHTALKLIYGTAFQAPSLFYRYEQFKTPILVMQPNYEQTFRLNNQRVKSAELVFLHRFNEKWQTDVTVYYSEATDLIARNVFTNRAFNSAVNGYTNGTRNENLGKQYSTGGTMVLNFTPHSGLSAYLQYAYTDARVRTNEQWAWLARVATHKAQAGVTVRNLWRVLTINTDIRWVGGVTAPVESKRYVGKMDGYFMLMGTVSCNHVLPNTRLFARCEQMIGAKEHVGIFAGGVYTDMIPQPAFVGKLGVEFKL